MLTALGQQGLELGQIAIDVMAQQLAVVDPLRVAASQTDGSRGQP